MTTPLRFDDPNLVFVFDGEELGRLEVGDKGFSDAEALAFLRGEIGQNAIVASDEPQTGAMIALVPDADTIQRLAVPGGEAPEDLHMTICYLGEAAKIVPMRRDHIIDSMKFASQEIPVVEASAFGVAEWNPNDPEKQTSLVYNIGGGEVDDAYEMLYDIIRGLMGDQLPEQYEPYVAHVCAAYSNDITLLNTMVQNLGYVRFDRLRVAFAGDVTDFDLYNGEQPDVTPGDDEMSDEYSLTADGLDEYYAVTFANALDRESRMRAAKSGKAMPDGSYPIRNVGELQKAIQAYGRASDKAATKRWIMRRARELNRVDLIPDNWTAAAGTDVETFAQKKESDVNLPGGSHNLRNYWVRGEGAVKIGWGTDGSFARCVALLGKHVTRPQGLCAEYHHAATGEWPTEHGKKGIPSSVDIAVTADGTETADATQIDSDGWWEGILAVEDVETGDQRKFSAGSLTWPDPASVTVPLMWTPQSEGAHKGAVVAGNVSEIWRDHVDQRIIRGRGRFDLGGEYGREAHRLTKEGMLSGISVDPDQVTDANVELIYPAKFDGDQTLVKPELTVYHAGRIRGATLLPFPAFVEAKLVLTNAPETAVTADGAHYVAAIEEPWSVVQHEIALGTEMPLETALGAFAHVHADIDAETVSRTACRLLHHSVFADGAVGDPNVTACQRAIAQLNSGRSFGLDGRARRETYEHLAAHLRAAGIEPDAYVSDDPIVACGDVQHPKKEWFDNPGLTGPSPLTVTDDGRVFGHAALWNSCHTSFAGSCTAPPYEADYSYFTTGEVVCDDGSRVAAGQITLGTSHAPTSGVTLNAAIDHYGNTGTAVADVAAGMDDHGIWVAGAVRPGTSGEHLHALRASALSGDWRRIGGSLRMVALLAVNVPGFPIPRTAAFVANTRQLSLVAAGIVDEKAVMSAEVDSLAAMIGRKRKKKSMSPSTTYCNSDVEALAVSIGRDPLSLLRQQVLG